MIERDKKTRSDLEEARRLFEDVGLSAEAEEASAIGSELAEQGPSRELATLYEIGQIINSISELEPLLERIMDLAIEALDAERGLILLAKPGSATLSLMTARQLEKETINDAIKYSEGVVKHAATGESIISGDAGVDPRYSDFRSVALYDIKSFMCVPLRLRNTTLGTVYVDSRRSGFQFQTDDLRFLEAFANQAALAIENARLMQALRDENRMLREVVSRQFGFDNVIGRSPAMERVLKTLAKLSKNTSPVMLLGQSGCGKELLAKAIHYNSSRSEQPFIALNCAALPRELLESELFGHVRGAFSGADRDKKGLLEAAQAGSFFFDEIGEMDPSLQAKLLRAVEEGAIRRVGDTRNRPINVRFISATNKDLKKLISKGLFREDLYYRLNVVSVRVPSLAERRQDIVLLAEHFLQETRQKQQHTLEGFTRKALDRMLAYHWPGNVRELENAIARAVALSDGPRVDLTDLPEEVLETADSAPDDSEARIAKLWLELTEGQADFWTRVRDPFVAHELARDDVRRLIQRGLEHTRGNYKQLAELFNVGSQYKKFHAFLKNSDCHLDRELFKLTSQESSTSE